MDFADGFFGGGIDHLEGLAILAFDELVVDEAAISLVSLRPGTFGGGGEISSDKVRGKGYEGTTSPLPRVQCLRLRVRDLQSSGLLVFACSRCF